MRHWFRWLIADPRNAPAWLAVAIQIIITMVGHTDTFYGYGYATAIATFTLMGAFILLGVETARNTRQWNGLGRALTLLSFAAASFCFPIAANTTYHLVAGSFQPMFDNTFAQLSWDLSRIIATFAAFSTANHMRHYYIVRKTQPTVQ